MSDPDTRSVLARIVAAHLGTGIAQADLVPGLQTGFTRAVRRAALPFAALSPQVAEVAVSCNATLQDAIDALPDHGLVAAIEDEDGRRGLIALDHPLVDALIEVQATGHVEDTDLPPRVVTRIDEALCRDFLDLMFGAFAQETPEQVGRDWPDRMSYGSCIMDRSRLNLLLPDRGFHLLRASVTAGGRKTGDLVMLLPADPALARRRAVTAPEATTVPVDWSAQMLRALGAAPMTLDAVLMRVTLSLGEVEALGEGELVPFERSDLNAITLEGEGGHVFARGSLGQNAGRRAVRLGQPGAPRPSPYGHATGAAPRPAPSAAPADLSATGAAAPAPAMAGFDPGTLMDAGAMAADDGGGSPPGALDLLPSAMDDLAGLPTASLDPNAPSGDFDPNAMMGDFDPNAPLGAFDPNAPIG